MEELNRTLRKWIDIKITTIIRWRLTKLSFAISKYKSKLKPALKYMIKYPNNVHTIIKQYFPSLLSSKVFIPEHYGRKILSILKTVQITFWKHLTEKYETIAM